MGLFTRKVYSFTFLFDFKRSFSPTFNDYFSDVAISGIASERTTVIDYQLAGLQGETKVKRQLEFSKSNDTISPKNAFARQLLLKRAWSAEGAHLCKHKQKH